MSENEKTYKTNIVNMLHYLTGYMTEEELVSVSEVVKGADK